MGDESNPNNMRLTVPYSTHPDTGAATSSINTPKEIVTQELSYLVRRACLLRRKRPNIFQDENYEQTHPTHTGGIHTPPKDIVTQDDSYLVRRVCFLSRKLPNQYLSGRKFPRKPICEPRLTIEPIRVHKLLSCKIKNTSCTTT
jgi:hypothetical protein